MIKTIVPFCLLVSLLFLTSCDSNSDKARTNSELEVDANSSSTNLLTDISTCTEDGDVNAVIEIPAGTIEKWELNKTTGEVQWEMVDNKPRIVNYIGYPGNYGMIPRTVLSKENGGDGDPLDIIVLGPPVERSEVVKCKVIGVLYLKDRGEQDDKLIAVSSDSPMYDVNNLEELNNNFKGISDIVKLWFENYKGPGKMKSEGFGDRKVAIEILDASIKDYQANKTH